MHKYWRMFAQDMTDAGYTDLRDFLTKPFEIPILKDTVEHMIWKRVQLALTGKEHSSDLEPHEVNLVYQHVSHYLSERHDLSTPFPSKEGL